MQVSRKWLVSAILVLALLFSGIFTALSLDTDSGRIDVKTVSITEGNVELSALLYRPKSATSGNPAGTVVLAHGISGSKEMMSSIGLELARRGFVSLCLDLYGHGKSQGTVDEGQREPSFGVCSAIKYLKSQPFVNSSALGLLGHSLGAGAVRAAVVQDTSVSALVLIAGGIGDIVEGPKYGVFNSTFPRNILVIVGKYDILFDIKELMTDELPTVFGVNQKVVPDVVYGNFSSQTARKLVLPLTTHLFEPTDSTVISESIDWMEKAIGKPQSADHFIGTGFVYLQREASIMVALVGMLGLPILSLCLIERFVHTKSRIEFAQTEKVSHGNWRLYLVWGVVNLALFVPMFGVGLGVSFPPLIFGSSLAWWMLGSGLLGLLLLTKFSKRIVGRNFVLKEVLVGLFAKDVLFLAFVAFAILFTAATFFAVFLSFNFRIVVPIFTDLSSASRVLFFVTFIPFFLPYFIVEGLYLHEFARMIPGKQANWSQMRNVAETVFGKIAPYIAILFLQYIMKIAFDIWLLPSFIGFMLEFLWLIVPIFAFVAIFSWWFYARIGNVFSGALFNALLMSWVASAVFPF